MSFHWERVVAVAEDGCLLRDVLRRGIGLSQRMLHALKFQGSIMLNGRPATVRMQVKTGDRISLLLPEAEQQRVIPEALPLQVIFEDDDLLVVEKPAGMIVHPVPPEPTGTLANAIAWYWQQQRLHLPVRVLTRLDRDTTGLVLVAKHALAQHHYSQRRAVVKQYLALVHGDPDADCGLIDAPIAVNALNPVTREVRADGKPAQTVWCRLDTTGRFSLLRAQLLTGRTHQIRVHLSWRGHPLLGDRQYDGSSELIARPALHCHSLSLHHLRTGQPLVFRLPLPADMQRLCADFHKWSGV